MSESNDVVVRGTAHGGCVRVLACVTTGLSNELQRKHQSWPVATAALGRTAAIGAMMGQMLKGEERLTLTVNGDGPIGKIVVDADPQGHVRGYVDNPFVDLPSNALGKLDVGGAVGNGFLYVLRDLGMRDVYRGSVEIQTGEIADDFTYYFTASEQTPSSVAAGVLVDTDNSVIASGGFIVQLLPGHTDADIAQLEARLSTLQSVTEFLKTGATASDLFHVVAPDGVIHESKSVEFRCTCSKDRLRAVLRSLGDAELASMIEDQGGAEVTCHFCNTSYQFSEEELTELLSIKGEEDGK